MFGSVCSPAVEDPVAVRIDEDLVADGTGGLAEVAEVRVFHRVALGVKSAGVTFCGLPVLDT